MVRILAKRSIGICHLKATKELMGVRVERCGDGQDICYGLPSLSDANAAEAKWSRVRP